ncbi:SMP-30/gluconolactonase/LRE family protein [Nocardia niigatensis]
MPEPRSEAAAPQSDPRGQCGRLGAALLLAVTAAAGGPAAMGGPAAAEVPATPISCSPTQLATYLPSRVPLADWSENLGFDASGNLWVARTFGNAVERYDRDGHIIASVPASSPGAVRLGPDGLMYVTFGNSPIAGLAHQGGVLRFDPEAAIPQPEVFVSGLGQANGAVFDAAGNLFVADTSSNTVERIRPDGTVDAGWTERARNALAANGSGADGIVVAGNMLYVTLLESPTARIVALPIDDPARAGVALDLAPGALLPDDLAIGPDGLLYITTGSGQFVRADPVTHTGCTLSSEQPLTSVAVDPSDNHTFLLGTEGGAVLKAHLD